VDLGGIKRTITPRPDLYCGLFGVEQFHENPHPSRFVFLINSSTCDYAEYTIHIVHIFARYTISEYAILVYSISWLIET
jgi:hypothetical protein